jgi:nucleotide-binding universal stress UspA family protein
MDHSPTDDDGAVARELAASADGGPGPAVEGPVVVAVADPDHVQQLVRTAGDLARVGSGTVRLVTVVAKPSDSPFAVFDDETIRREFAGDSRQLLARATPPAGVTVERDVVPARSIAGGIVRAVEDTDPAALVVGWSGPARRSDAVLGTTVDDLIRRAPCDLYVERVGREAGGVETVLLPVAGGPNVRPAASAAKAIAARNGASVRVLTVVGPDVTRTDRTDDTAATLEAGRAAVAAASGPEVPVETAVESGEDVAATIVRAATEADVVVIGATRNRSRFGRRLVGSVPRRVAAGTDRTVLLARSSDAVNGVSGRLGRLFGR